MMQVRDLALRGKIFNIHYRNIVGGTLPDEVPNFTEVWPDEGDINMPQLAKTLYDAGYP
jgi:D-mannonate dehydratase